MPWETPVEFVVFYAARPGKPVQRHRVQSLSGATADFLNSQDCRETWTAEQLSANYQECERVWWKSSRLNFAHAESRKFR
jgi:hypothetical protein